VVRENEDLAALTQIITEYLYARRDS
jgi:hypothetical protein